MGQISSPINQSVKLSSFYLLYITLITKVYKIALRTNILLKQQKKTTINSLMILLPKVAPWPLLEEQISLEEPIVSGVTFFFFLTAFSIRCELSDPESPSKGGGSQC